MLFAATTWNTYMSIGVDQNKLNYTLYFYDLL